jgi:acetylglutamate kinase
VCRLSINNQLLPTPSPPLLPQIAAALQAEKLILMTDVPGVLRDKDDVATKFNSLNIRECRQLTEEGIIAGGMIPKVGSGGRMGGGAGGLVQFGSCIG